MESNQAQAHAQQRIKRVGIFNVRVVHRGEQYGLNDCLVHDKEDPLVEFYDARQSVDKFGRCGQFVSRYYASTLLESRCGADGLLLDGGSRDWVVSPSGMTEVLAHVRAAIGDSGRQSVADTPANAQWPAVFGDGVVCNSQDELDEYLIGGGHFDPIPHGSELYTQICFAVGELDRDRLEDAAADADIEFDKWTSDDELRALVIDAARSQGGIMLIDSEGDMAIYGYGLVSEASPSRPRGG